MLALGSIEILKGPQGTLYGTPSMGGLLRYNTRTPESDYFSGLVGGEVSRTGAGGTSATGHGHSIGWAGAGDLYPATHRRHDGLWAPNSNVPIAPSTSVPCAVQWERVGWGSKGGA